MKRTVGRRGAPLSLPSGALAASIDMRQAGRLPGEVVERVPRRRQLGTGRVEDAQTIVVPDDAADAGDAHRRGRARIPELGASLVCGAANNQLETEDDGARLVARGVTYAPDYVVNAGGIISVSAEYLGETQEAVDARVRSIPGRMMHVLELARSERVPPHVAADRIVKQRLAQARKA